MKKIFVLLVCLAFVGCSSNSGVAPMGKDTYMVSRQAATGFSGTGRLKVDALQEASRFCEKQGKKMLVTATSEAQPPYVMANFPRAEVQFACLDENDPAFQRARLDKVPDVIIKKDETLQAGINVHTTEDNNKVPDLYAELTKLDDLRKKGILTDGEFQTQKTALLAKQR